MVAHFIDFVLGDDIIEHDPKSAQQVDDLQWTQRVDTVVSRTTVNIRSTETELSLQWTQLGDERSKVVDVREVN